MKVSAQYAESHFNQLLIAAKAGEEVEINTPDRISFRLQLVSSENRDQKTKLVPRVLGAGRGELRVPSEEEWAEMDAQLRHEMNDAPLTTSDHM